jgi:insertion element IS1 protein InsB
MVTVTLRCQHCESRNLVRNGLTADGRQRYLCRVCGQRSRTAAHERLQRRGARADTARLRRTQFLARPLAHLRSVAPNRHRVAQNKVAELPALSETLLEVERPVLELDELWSFVLQKARKRRVRPALCRQTLQVVASVVGDRSAQTCRRLREATPEAFRRAHCYTDLWEAYSKVLPPGQHTAVGKESGQTAHVERWDLTLRQRLARFVRRTLSCSKSSRMHEACLQLFIHRYNYSHALTLM